MAKDQDAVALAYLGQAVTAMRQELGELRTIQNALLATLTALLAANEAQSSGCRAGRAIPRSAPGDGLSGGAAAA